MKRLHLHTNDIGVVKMRKMSLECDRIELNRQAFLTPAAFDCEFESNLMVIIQSKTHLFGDEGFRWKTIDILYIGPMSLAYDYYERKTLSARTK